MIEASVDLQEFEGATMVIWVDWTSLTYRSEHYFKQDAVQAVGSTQCLPCSMAASTALPGWWEVVNHKVECLLPLAVCSAGSGQHTVPSRLDGSFDSPPRRAGVRGHSQGSHHRLRRGGGSLAGVTRPKL